MGHLIQLRHLHNQFRK